MCTVKDEISIAPKFLMLRSGWLLQALLSLKNQQQTNFSVVIILVSDVVIMYDLEKNEMFLQKAGRGAGRRYLHFFEAVVCWQVKCRR